MRLDRLRRPRASAGVVALVLGVALLAAAGAAVVAQGAVPTRSAAWLLGAGVLVLVLGLGIVAVGLARRRSGVLSFLGILSILTLAVALLVPTDRQLLPPGTSYGLDRRVDGRYAQLAGTTSVYVTDRQDGDEVPVIDLWQYAGSVLVDLDDGAAVRVEIVTDATAQGLYLDERFDDGSSRGASYVVRDGKLTATIGGGEPDLVLRVWMGAGVGFIVRASSPAGQPLPLDPQPEFDVSWGPDGQEAPSPSPTSTEGVIP